MLMSPAPTPGKTITLSFTPPCSTESGSTWSVPIHTQALGHKHPKFGVKAGQWDHLLELGTLTPQSAPFRSIALAAAISSDHRLLGDLV